MAQGTSATTPTQRTAQLVGSPPTHPGAVEHLNARWIQRERKRDREGEGEGEGERERE